MASHRSRYRRSMARTVVSASPIRRATCRAAALSHRILKALAVGRLARQRRHFLCLHSAFRTANSIQFNDYHRLVFEARQIANRTLVDFVNVLDPPAATGTPQYPVAALPPHPQFQAFVLLVDLVTRSATFSRGGSKKPRSWPRTPRRTWTTAACWRIRASMPS